LTDGVDQKTMVLTDGVDQKTMVLTDGVDQKTMVLTDGVDQKNITHSGRPGECSASHAHQKVAALWCSGG
jgi:hypothetical protein